MFHSWPRAHQPLPPSAAAQPLAPRGVEPVEIAPPGRQIAAQPTLLSAQPTLGSPPPTAPLNAAAVAAVATVGRRQGRSARHRAARCRPVRRAEAYEQVTEGRRALALRAACGLPIFTLPADARGVGARVEASDPIETVRGLAVGIMRFDEWQTTQWERFSALLSPSSGQATFASVDAALAVRAFEFLERAGDQALAAALGERSVARAILRASELEASELGRLRGRLDMSASAGALEGAFESEGVRRAAARLVQSGIASPAYRAYCRWRAYGELLSTPSEGRAPFIQALKATLFDGLGVSAPSLPGPRVVGGSSRRDVAALRGGLAKLLEACREAGLLAAWALELDGDIAELWEEGVSGVKLSFAIVVEGDPFENAQVLLADRRDAVVPSRGVLVPNATAELVTGWLQGVMPVESVRVETYYADMRYSSILGLATPGQERLEVTVT